MPLEVAIPDRHLSVEQAFSMHVVKTLAKAAI